MKKLLGIAFIFLLFGCQNNAPESAIKKDLNNRYTGFEIVEIKPDSSNVYDAEMTLISLKLNISDAKLKIVKAESNYYEKKWSLDKTKQYMDSVSKAIDKECNHFYNLKDSKKELCYYVKYRFFKEESKIEKEEYYYIRPYGEGKVEYLYRPYNWFDYLEEINYNKLISECPNAQIDFLRDLIAGY